MDVYLELSPEVGLSYPNSVKRSLQSKLEFTPNIYPLFPGGLPRHGFKKAKKFFDERGESSTRFP